MEIEEQPSKSNQSTAGEITSFSLFVENPIERDNVRVRSEVAAQIELSDTSGGHVHVVSKPVRECCGYFYHSRYSHSRVSRCVLRTEETTWKIRVDLTAMTRNSIIYSITNSVNRTIRSVLTELFAGLRSSHEHSNIIRLSLAFHRISLDASAHCNVCVLTNDTCDWRAPRLFFPWLLCYT